MFVLTVFVLTKVDYTCIWGPSWNHYIIPNLQTECYSGGMMNVGYLYGDIPQLYACSLFKNAFFNLYQLRIKNHYTQ